MYKSSQLDIADIEILPGNIMYATARKGAEIDLENVKRMVKHVDSMFDSSDLLRGGIFDISNVTYMNEEAREYLASGLDTTGVTVGMAFVYNSFIGSIISNLFATITRTQQAHIQFFESPIRAEHWIRTRMRKEREFLNGQDEVSRRVA